MADKVYLGVDLGAESGRVMAGLWDGKKIRLEEQHRFANGPVDFAGTLRWDVLKLWSEIQTGLTAAGKKLGSSIVSVGADTWGVDFVLLSKTQEILGQPFHYRDARTRGMFEEAFKRVPRDEIFAHTGLQFMELNSLYQLLALQKQSPELLANAATFLTIPDFLHWCLCGSRVCEFSNATTTQCYSPSKRGWATEMLQKFGLPTGMFPEIVDPGTRLGLLRDSVAAKTGLGKIHVTAPAAHDTGSAVAAVPTAHTGKTNWAYISSGTWSLMGLEVSEARLTPRTLALNYTNEGGVNHTYRLLKNIMGLWLIQQSRRAFTEKGENYDYVQIAQQAAASPAFRSLVNPDDGRFLNPPDMTAAIQSFCRETGQPVPETIGQFARCVYESLALKYANVLDSLEELGGTPIEVIHVVGGGSQNLVLNPFTANACNRPVITGPVEATVIGNLLVQAMADGEVKSLSDIRAVVRESFEVKTILPQAETRQAWQDARGRFAQLCAAK